MGNQTCSCHADLGACKWWRMRSLVFILIFSPQWIGAQNNSCLNPRTSPGPGCQYNDQLLCVRGWPEKSKGGRQVNVTGITITITINFTITIIRSTSPSCSRTTSTRTRRSDAYQRVKRNFKQTIKGWVHLFYVFDHIFYGRSV